MSESRRWTQDEMYRLAARGVLKVDLLGERGITLVTCEELAAMATVLAISGAVPPAYLRAPNLTQGATE